MSRVLLHNDDGLLQGILLVDLYGMSRLNSRHFPVRIKAYLFLELFQNELILAVGILFRGDSHGGILIKRYGARQIRDVFRRQFAFFGNTASKSAGVVLDVLDMCFDLESQFLQMLDNRAFDSLSEIRVMVSDDAGLVSDVIVNILESFFTKELISRFKRNLDDGTKFSKFFGSIVLYVSDALKVGNELFGDGLPSGEPGEESMVLSGGLSHGSKKTRTVQ